MFNNKVKQYQKEALKARVAAADPHQIIQMLMEGALESMKIAVINIEQNDLENRSKFLSKATSIIDALRLSLDMSVGGDLADNLAALYVYMRDRLMEAALQNDQKPILEVIDLLSGIKSAWDQIPESAKVEAYQQFEQRAMAAGA